MLGQCFCIPPMLSIFLPPSVCFLFVFECGQEFLVHPHRPPGIFACLNILWDRTLLSLEEISDFILWVLYKIHKRKKGQRHSSPTALPTKDTLMLVRDSAGGTWFTLQITPPAVFPQPLNRGSSDCRFGVNCLIYLNIDLDISNFLKIL